MVKSAKYLEELVVKTTKFSKYNTRSNVNSLAIAHVGTYMENVLINAMHVKCGMNCLV